MHDVVRGALPSNVEYIVTGTDRPATSRTPRCIAGLLVVTCCALSSAAAAQAPRGAPFPTDAGASVPDLTQLAGAKGSELVGVVQRYALDEQTLGRRYDAFDSPDQRTRMRAFYSAWRTRLRALDFEKLSQEGRIDYVLLDNHLRYELDLADRQDRMRTEAAPLLPFSDALLALHDARRDLEVINAQQAARTLADLTRQVDSLRLLLEPAARGDS
ncbi:MAG TPA: hypothetical protein VE861_16970, partial [Gemmatimonadaceae bacterium]|nr:hypothetical protein [Gemmatimonadaceae bacterium]